MKKTYWVKKNPNSTADWIEMNGKQFYEFIKSPAGKGRYFINFGDFKLEATYDEYRKDQREKDHSRYLEGYETDATVSSLESRSDKDGISYGDLIVDLSVNVEEEAIKNIEMQILLAAVNTLPENERQFINELFSQENRKSEQELATILGISKQAINKRKIKIYKKLKKLVVKTQKSSQ